MIAAVTVIKDFLSALVDTCAIASQSVGVAEDNAAFACAISADIVVPVATCGLAGTGVTLAVTGGANARVEADKFVFARSAVDGV